VGSGEAEIRFSVSLPGRGVNAKEIMLRARDLSELIEMDRQDVLSVSLDIDRTKPEHQKAHPAYAIWLRNSVRELLNGFSKEDRRNVEDLSARVLSFVEDLRPEGRGLVVFAAPDFWRQYFLPFPVPNRLRYGRADVMPMLWAIDEYEPYAILFVDREHARVMIAYLGAATVVEEETLELDTSDWRFKAGRPPTSTKQTGTGAGRGAQRDTFEARVDEHIRRFWQGAAEAAARWLETLEVRRLIIGGPEEAASAVRDLLPEPVRNKVVALVPLPAYAGTAEIQELTLPVALAEEHRRDAELVAQLLEAAGAGSRAAVGKAATLNALMQGQVMTLVAARDLDGDVWRCTACAYVAADAVAPCPVCGGVIQQTPFAQLLPQLAHRNAATIELVG
jgi:rubrerythrin